MNKNIFTPTYIEGWAIMKTNNSLKDELRL